MRATWTESIVPNVRPRAYKLRLVWHIYNTGSTRYSRCRSHISKGREKCAVLTDAPDVRVMLGHSPRGGGPDRLPKTDAADGTVRDRQALQYSEGLLHVCRAYSMLEGERTFDKLMERSHSEGRRRESTSERSVGRKARRRTRTGLEHIVPDETGNSATECTGMKPDRPRGGKWGCK